MSNEKEPFDLDVILTELGQFGRYQRMVYAIIALPIMMSAVYSANYVFVAGELNYRCKIPQCEADPPTFTPGPWGSWALPEGGGQCEQKVPTGTSCAAGSFDLNKTQPCTSWVYESDYTIVEAYDLACANWKRTLVGSINSAGIFFALPLTSYVSDTYGRRTAFALTAFFNGFFGVVRSFSTSYIMHLILEFLNSTFGSGVYSAGYILALELVGKERRVLGGNVLSCMFAVGQVLLALTAWGVPYWRNLMRILFTPSLIFILYFFVLNESVRWLFVKGRNKEAVAIILKAAKFNKKTLSPEALKILSVDPNNPTSTDTVVDTKDVVGTSSSKSKLPSLHLRAIRSKVIMTRLCICSFWWITVTFIYYGLSINSVSLAGNKYLNYILTSLVEIPGYAISVVALDRFGRKRSIMTAFAICGMALLVLPFIPDSLQWFELCLLMVSKMTISMVFSSIYIYTCELFPTELRHGLLAACSMIGRIGNVTAPQTPLLMVYAYWLPFVIFGVMAAISAFLMIFTPETLHKQLPDTISQAETIGHKLSKAGIAIKK